MLYLDKASRLSLRTVSFFRTILNHPVSILSITLLLAIAVQTGCSTNPPLPDVADAYHDRGKAKLLLDEDYNGAVEDLSLAIKFNPNDPNLYVTRGLAYLKAGNTDAARKDFDEAVAINPGLKPALKPLRDGGP
jgi:tetratricopeptide (TPR) repeat protein